MDNQHRHIKGYRDLSAEEIAAMNDVKSTAGLVEALVGRLKVMPDVDQRWLAIGVTDLQKGFMAITRAVAKPTTF
jgi:hypothetical protein